jgi:hypothetical protein
VGYELTIAQDPRIDTAKSPRDRVVAELVRPGVRPNGQPGVRSTIPDDGATPAPAQAAAPGRALAVVDVSWSAVTVDPEEVIVTLQAERSAARAGFDHPHTLSHCVFCRRAAATYR